MKATAGEVDLESLLACPRCKAAVRKRDHELTCCGCGAVFQSVRGIPLMFSPECAGEPDGVTSLYDAIAHEYDQSLPAHIVEHYLRRRVDLIGRYGPRGAVLDVGCGTGRLAGRLAEAGYAVVGVDASLGMLEIMCGRTHARAVAGFADGLPFRSEAFDVVVSVATLHHIADAGKVAATISEMYRVARRPGTVIIWDHNPLNPYWPFLMKRVPQDSGEERLIPLEEIMATLRSLGPGRLEAKRLGFTPEFVPPPAMVAWGVVERLAEQVPLLRDIAAHNVIIAQKV